MSNQYPLSIAPMMDWTDRHCRYFMRVLSPRVRLYTEMVTAAALHHGDVERHLAFDSSEHPIALQLGGSEPTLMAEAAALAEEYGYDEININVGCPSDRVQSGAFGACLMAEPKTVARCIEAMQLKSRLPITVKTRIGIDDKDNFAFLKEFADTVLATGCNSLVVHARIAILSGLSPKENRSIPPLNYPRVYRLKEQLPETKIVINGGITTVAEVEEHLRHVDGVMIGRQGYQQPWFLAELESHFGGAAPATRHNAAMQMLPYIEARLTEGVPLNRILRHMLGLFAGEPGARAWRRHISEHAHRNGAGPEVLEKALLNLPVAA